VSLFLASALASCPAGLVNIPDVPKLFCTKIQLKKIKKDYKNTYVVQKYPQQSENAERNKSKWIILSNYLQDDVKHVLTMKPVAENKLVQIRWKQSVRRAKLASQFPFGAHPHTFNELSVYVSISRINKMSLMHSDRVHVDAMPQLIYVSIGWPPVRHNT